MRYGRILSLLLLGLYAAASWAGPAGKVLAMVGEVFVERQGQTVRLTPGAAIENGDILRVGDKGALQVRFTDESIVSLRANSVLKIEEFRFERNPETDRSVLDLLRGGMRTITGLVGKGNRDNYSVKHRAATIGIRGTFYTLVSCDAAFPCYNFDGTKANHGIYGGVTDGRIAVKNDVGTFEFGQQEQFRLAGRDSKPERLLMPPAFLNAGFDGGVRGRGNGQGPVNIGESKSSAATDTTNSPQGSGRIEIVTVLPPVAAMPNTTDSQLPGSVVPVADGVIPTATTGMATIDAATNPGNQSVSVVERRVGASASWDAQGLVGFSCGAGCSLSRGGATVVDQGADAGVVAWGRWTGGPLVSSGWLNGQSFNGTQGVGYVAGVPTASMPTTGTAVSYNLLGATSLTFGDGSGAGLGLGTITAASATVNFVAQNASVSATASFAGGNVYQVSVPTTAISGSGFTSSAAALTRTAGPTNVCPGGACTGNAVGQFYGPLASHLGVGYDIRTTTATPTSANGVIVLKR